MTEIFVIVWSGGYEIPQYEIKNTLEGAQKAAIDWRSDASEEDVIDIIRVDLQSLTFEVIPIA
jgi:hypothetical protein